MKTVFKSWLLVFFIESNRNPLAFKQIAFVHSTSQRYGMSRLNHSSNPDTSGISKQEDKQESTHPIIQNFRQAASLPNIYRCASTDNLADIFTNNINPIHPNDDIVLNKSGLILDLRSSSERNEAKSQLWMNQAPGGKIQISTPFQNEQSSRKVMRIDVLSPSRLFEYLTDHWLTPTQKALSALYFTIDANKLHELRMDVLNKRSLSGLYEAILQTSQTELFTAMKEITLFLENSQNYKKNVNTSQNKEQDAIIVHCVQGKDRTGILIMICQSILGLSDEKIIHDYHLSHKNMYKGSSAAGEMLTKKGKLDRNVFSGAPKTAIMDTLSFIRKEYGSVSPAYLDSIGFDKSWRIRFLNALDDDMDVKSRL